MTVKDINNHTQTKHRDTNIRNIMSQIETIIK